MTKTQGQPMKTIIKTLQAYNACALSVLSASSDQSSNRQRDEFNKSGIFKQWLSTNNLLQIKARAASDFQHANLFKRVAGIILLLTLTACGDIVEDDLLAQQSGEAYNNTFDPDNINNFQGFPGDATATLRWDNPLLEVAAYNLTVYDVENEDAIVEEASNANLTAADGINITAGARGVEYTITNGLENDRGYRFDISVRLVADVKFKKAVRLGNRREASQQDRASARLRGKDIVVIGTNQDGDEYADAEDSCPNSPRGRGKIIDADKDGCHDAEDALPNDGRDFRDSDNDTVFDRYDSCRLGVTGWTSNPMQDHDGDGCNDLLEDDDDDNDRVADSKDSCARGFMGWRSSPRSDYDRDGCNDIQEDDDDDNDRVVDSEDSCPLSVKRGKVFFVSNRNSDYDGDGCRDAVEDTDDDADTIADKLDSCQLSKIAFVSNTGNDYDGDGCRDANEDGDDDGDKIADVLDACPLSMQVDKDLFVSNSRTDYDGDGCRDAGEDKDDDGDKIADLVDSCPLSIQEVQLPAQQGNRQKRQALFVSNSQTDYDGDGCRDAGEDKDDDADTVADRLDSCQLSKILFVSTEESDYDGDGCRDANEDSDDDADTIVDTTDLCRRSKVLFVSKPGNDYDGDGCRNDEDTDDDGDTIADTADLCRLSTQESAVLFVSNSTSDYDGDGCHDNEDGDDDGDTIADTADSCQISKILFVSKSDTDYDGDGCRDANEDMDDDADTIADTADLCQLSKVLFISSPSNDYDGDGCRNDEDGDDDADTIADTADSCPLSMKASQQEIRPLFRSNADSDYDGDGCRDADEDLDDDGDTIVDTADSCQLSMRVDGMLFVSSPDTDLDGDGCRNDNEDTDNDGDTIANNLDNCPLTMPEILDSVSSGPVLITFVPSPENDQDGDGCRDADEDTDIDADGTLNEDDYDDDGNGLIDIANVSDFNLIRENLRGSNLPDIPGCLNSGPIGEICYGYELVADIDFSGHDNWEPLGSCEVHEEGTNLPLCISSNMFSLLLEGNNHTLSNISIHQNSRENTFGIGLFGAIASPAEIRNMHLAGVSITKGSGSFPWYVGALVGVADGGTISSVSVSGDSVIGSFFVGGLVGFSYKGTLIDNTHAKFTKVESTFQNVGGLVGYISDCTITSSSAKSNEISSLFSPGGRSGGLAGTLDRCNVRQSYAINGIVNSKDQHVGGLIGISDN
ncbi:MAG: thrombospondin type 3 repeat-containing protein, partial [Gammaproteobacteria bacterium]|nr:thrombospondin type 3 repeat-containing protein [Gammaproteobacteria bacterium]